MRSFRNFLMVIRLRQLTVSLKIHFLMNLKIMFFAL